MRVLFINAFFGRGSTGRIVETLFLGLKKRGVETYAISGFDDPKLDDVLALTTSFAELKVKMTLVGTRVTGYGGFGHRSKTKKICAYIDKIKPDVINAHNLHTNYVDLPYLLEFIKSRHIPIVFTMHDCWLFTGHCPHFVIYGCQKWKTKCEHCEHLKECAYPKTWFFDRSKEQFERKLKAFDGLDFDIVTPCKWLGSFVPDSPILHACKSNRAIYNGIDFDKVAPKANDSFLALLDEKKILTFVSSKLSVSKGIKEIGQLAKLLSDDYKIVLVGKPDSEMILQEPNVAYIGTVSSQTELKYIYDHSYALINMTLADTFPTTNIEALQSGAKVITYDTGGCAELRKEGMVYVSKENTPESFLEALKESENDFVDRQAIIDYGKAFSTDAMIAHYHEAFEAIANRRAKD